MSLGERIAGLRKEKGLTQEALGEQVGVTRQAVSKWEADRAVPDVNNCIAMSRVFGIPLAQLLELEEEEEKTAAAIELNDAQLKLIEQMTERYMAAQKKARRRWRWPVLLLCCGLLVGGAWLWEWLNDMNRTIEHLSSELSGMQGEIIHGIGNRVQESLEAESSLISNYTVTVDSADVMEKQITYDVSVMLKEGGADTQVGLMISAEGSTYTGSMEQTAELCYVGRITCPIQEEIPIYLMVEENGQRRSQLLKTMYADQYDIRLDGWVRWASLTKNGSGLSQNTFEAVEVMVFCDEAPGLKEPLTVKRLEVVQFHNDAPVYTVPLDPAQEYTAAQTWSLDIPVDLTELQTGHTLTFALMAEDNYSRTSSHILSRYCMGEDGMLNYQAEEMMKLDDGTYGTEVWP